MNSTQTQPHRSETGSASTLYLETVDLECVRSDRLLFAGLNLSLRPGNLIQIEGPNGSGKTSLLRILCGLTSPTQGEVRWCGRDIRATRPEYMAAVAYLGHSPGLKGDLTPRENLAIARGFAAANAAVSVDEALERLEMSDFDDQPVRTLSAGQKRRVALARLLAIETTVWILDEPYTALDRNGVRLVEKMIAEHLLRGGMAVLTTHHPVSIAESHVTRVDLGT